MESTRFRQTLGHFVLPALLLILSVGIVAGTTHAAGTAAGTLISATATVTFEDTNQNAGSDMATANVTVRKVAGVDVSTTASGVNYTKPGNDIAYPTTVKNTGNFTDTLDLTATLPSGAISAGWTATIFEDTNGNGALDSGETSVVSDTGTIAADSTYKVIVVDTPPSGAQDGDQYDATFTATSQFDSNTKHTATFTTKITDVVLTLTIDASPSTPKPGDTVTYTVTLENTGTGTATNIVVGNPVPASVSYTTQSITFEGNSNITDLSDSDEGTYDSNNDKITVEPGDLTGGSTVTCRAGGSNPSWNQN